MDHKIFKQDLTYAIKKLSKEGMILVSHQDNLEFANGKLIPSKLEVSPLEALILIKYPEFVFSEILYDEKSGINTYLQDPKDPDFYVVNGSLTYNISIFSLIEKYYGLSFSNISSFYDGLEGVRSSKNEFYDVGVYIREKFLPTDFKLIGDLPVYVSTENKELLKQWVIHSTKKGTFFKEVEYFIVHDIVGLHNGEWKGTILKPKELYELDYKNQLSPPTYCWHSFISSLDECYLQYEERVKIGLIKSKRKDWVRSGFHIDDLVIDETLLAKEVESIISKVQVDYLK